jgi:hypothetical protein
VTILSGGRTTTLRRGLVTGDDLWLPLSDLAPATGWELKPEGVCRDEACIPVRGGLAEQILREAEGETWFNLIAFARYVEQPIAHDADGRVWSFGPPAYEQQGRAGTGLAPDFTLPDFEGRPHALSDERGKKVFLLTWASW